MGRPQADLLASPGGWSAFQVSPNLALTLGFFPVSSPPQCSFVVSKAFPCPHNLAPRSTYPLWPCLCETDSICRGTNIIGGSVKGGLGEGGEAEVQAG